MLTLVHMLLWLPSLAASAAAGLLFGNWFGHRENQSKFEELKRLYYDLKHRGSFSAEATTKLETEMNRVEVLIRDTYTSPLVTWFAPKKDLEALAISRSSPPLAAEFLLCLFARKKDTVTLVGDLAEYFSRDLDAGISVRRAKLRYWARVLGSIGPQVWQMLQRVGRDVTRLS